MKKIIVTTTINPPTEALIKFSQKKDWDLIVVGDLKTPHELYKSLNCIYLSPEVQEKKYPELSEKIGWNRVQRRSIGFIEAYNIGADVMATVDDDNIPYDDWGDDLYVGKEINCDYYESELNVFDPLSPMSDTLWHRGYPISLVCDKNEITYKGEIKRKVLVQADLWDGDPDIEAIARLIYKPNIKWNVSKPYCSNKISPFNSQNTFLAREIIPYYCMFPFVGRMDDIWASYFIQCLFPNSVIYNRASVRQDRNEHDLIKDLEDEIIGYKETFKLIKLWQSGCQTPEGIPEESLNVYKEYRKQFIM